MRRFVCTFVILCRLVAFYIRLFYVCLLYVDYALAVYRNL